ncbi:MAG: flavodoxin domain-containing protein [Proteobacteria bacterium]|nr:flavodoxin domain-containing protein [Pseudomonadota bacterium]
MKKDALLIFASTSGSTTLLAEHLARVFSSSIDLIRIPRECVFSETLNRKLIVLMSPTYAEGNLHHAWIEQGPLIFRTLAPGQRIALIALGDSRLHKATFAGALKVFHDILSQQNAQLIGDVSADEISYPFGPSNMGGRFPGLPVEFRKERAQTKERACTWLADCLRRADAH